jgi:membrane-bound lytic murein transglycosylase F
LSEEIGAPIYIDSASSAITSEELIDKVASGEINYTVADENIARVMQHFFPNIDISIPLSMKQKISFALRKNSRKLLTSYNLWFNNFKKTKKYKYLLKKYFNDRSFYASMYKSDYYFPETGKISPFDDIIKENAQLIGWDWELLASLIYQESHFNPKAKSWAGAFGLMQLMPNTAKRFGVDSISSPAQQIAAGVKFLKYLDKQWAKTVKDSVQRQKFVLASYNVGLGHIIDARNLAQKYGANSTVWDNNVEYYIRLKSKPKYYKDEVVKFGYCRGLETYLYVKKVWERYIHYKNFTAKYSS